MARENNLLAHLSNMLSGFDEASLIALANKGLYRRACKDLEKGISIAIGESTESGLLIQVAEFTVTLPESGPGQANCTCPAPGVCRHILCACLFLQQSALAENEDQVSEDHAESRQQEDRAAHIADELLAVSHDELRKWAGTAEFREALKLAVAEGEAELQAGDPLLVRLPQSGQECRYPAGNGLEGWIVKGPNRKRVRTIVAAILLFQKIQGRPLPQMPAGNTRKETLDGTRSREEMLSAAQRLLEESVTVGLAHLSPAIRERANSLSISARGFKLYRLSLELKSIAKEIGLHVARSAQADSERLLLNMSRTFALCEALRQPGADARTDLLGTAKSQYDSITRLELAGVGAYTWRTRSNYCGLTLLFWENERKRLYSWSDARPQQNASRFNPAARYHSESPWQGGDNPEKLSRSAFTLLNAARNPQNRLSSSPKTQCIITGATHPDRLDFGERMFTDWEKLVEYSRSLAPIGLKRVKPLDDVVFIKPSIWGRRDFDPVQQLFSWLVQDENGCELPLALFYSEQTEVAIHFLEQLTPPERSSWVLTVKIIRNKKGFFLLPYSILNMETDARDSLLNVGLDQLETSAPKTPRKNNITAKEAKGEKPEAGNEEKEETEILSFGNQLDLHFAELEQQVSALAERGVKQFSQTDRQFFQRESEFLQRCGLASLANALQAFSDASQRQRSRRLLKIVYLFTLYRQASAVM